MKESNKVTAIGGQSPTNGGEESITVQRPYAIEVELQGSVPILFHRWNCEAVEGKANAKKGSKEKKSDNVESYVYRNEADELCIPGEYLRGAVVGAAKFQQDPRSPRKSAADLFKAGIVPLTTLASLGAKDWDYEDRRRVQVQRNAITRCRPAMKEGWKAVFQLQCLLPEYIGPEMLNATIQAAGRLVGLADFRPTFGRFDVTRFEVLQA